jgi:hypothetical protein
MRSLPHPPPRGVCFAKSFISARCRFFAVQNRHNKGVIYQNRHNKGLNGKKERFRPVFAGKIVQIKELCAIKKPGPELPGPFSLLIPFYKMAQN